MRHIKSILLTLLILLSVSSAFKPAMGVSLHREPLFLDDAFEYSLLGIGAVPGIRLPFEINESLCLEPEFMFWQYRTKYDYDDYDGKRVSGLYSLYLYLTMIKRGELLSYRRGVRLGL